MLIIGGSCARVRLAGTCGNVGQSSREPTRLLELVIVQKHEMKKHTVDDDKKSYTSMACSCCPAIRSTVASLLKGGGAWLDHMMTVPRRGFSICLAIVCNDNKGKNYRKN